MRPTLGKAAALGAGLGVCLLFALNPGDQAWDILLHAQFRTLQVVFLLTSAVMVVYMGYTWLSTLKDSHRHAKRVNEIDRIAEEVRRTRLQFQLEAAEKARAAVAEAEAKQRAAAEEAAARAQQSRAASATRTAGGGQVLASDGALAQVRARQQEAAAQAQAEFLRQLQEQEAQKREQLAAEAAAAAAAAKAAAAARQPGGGSVHASTNSLKLAREKQQQALGERSHRGEGLRSGGPGAGASERRWDGPIFPGDELRGWVSPASEEAARIRASQDAELARSLRRDQAREDARLAKENAAEEAAERRRQEQEQREERRAVLLSLLPAEPCVNEERVSIAVRLPDSSVRKRFWLPSNTMEDLYNWVESMEMLILKKLQLVKPFPREVLERGDATFEALSFLPQALVVVELLDG